MVMQEFCNISGQKVNTHKSKLYVSKNTSLTLAGDLEKKFDIPLSDNLIIYLGMPPVHGIKTRNLYDFIVNKVKKKLSHWKKRTISRATRNILIQSVTSAIPAYAMQTTNLPVCIFEDLEKLNRKFFWGKEES